jgi:hypothetical protein
MLCSSSRAVQTVSAVDHSVVPFFREAAKKLLATIDEPEVALALALAKITGHTAMKARSLLTAHEGFTTIMYTGEQQVGCWRPGLRGGDCGGGLCTLACHVGMFSRSACLLYIHTSLP